MLSRICAAAVRNRRDFARDRSARKTEIIRMASAFEHDDMKRAQ
ncbi:hypothetical protein [Profundibacter sp.]